MIGSQECTPGHYNKKARSLVDARLSYPQGATDYFKYLKDWRESGSFEGLVFDET